MSIKSDMLYRAGLYDKWQRLDEMAVKEINVKVRELINNGKYEEAAELYVRIWAGYKFRKPIEKVTPEEYKSAAVSTARGIEKTIANVKLIDRFIGKPLQNKETIAALKEKLSKFKQEVINISHKLVPPGTEEKRAWTRKGTTGTTKTGKKIEAPVMKQRRIKGGSLKKIEQELGSYKKEIEVVRTGSVDELRKLAKGILVDWGLGLRKKPEDYESFGPDNEDATVEQFLYAFVFSPSEYIQFGKTEKERIIVIRKMLMDILEEGVRNLEALYTTASEGPRRELTDEQIKKIGIRSEKIKERRQERISKKLGKKEKKVEERFIDVRGQILSESLGYEGSYFWENYIMSKLLKRFAEDAYEYGIEEARDMYLILFGEETYPIFDYLVENEDLLYEAYEVEGLFLFEDIGRKNVERYLKEYFKPPISPTGAIAPSGILGFLKGIWQKIKAFGGPIIKKISGWIGKGIGWAKGLLKKGVKFFTTNPIAKVALPAVLIAGGVIGGIALINKLRKKAKMKKLSKQEEKETRLIIQKKDAELERLKRKGVPGIEKIRQEVRTPRVRVEVG